MVKCGVLVCEPRECLEVRFSCIAVSSFNKSSHGSAGNFVLAIS